MAITPTLRLALAIALVPITAASAGEEHNARHQKPAFAIPEPSDLVLFAAGVVGLIIGRSSSRSRRRDD